MLSCKAAIACSRNERGVFEIQRAQHGGDGVAAPSHVDRLRCVGSRRRHGGSLTPLGAGLPGAAWPGIGKLDFLAPSRGNGIATLSFPQGEPVKKKASRWSQRVTETSNAMDLEPDVFKQRSAKKIAETGGAGMRNAVDATQIDSLPFGDVDAHVLHQPGGQKPQPGTAQGSRRRERGTAGRVRPAVCSTKKRESGLVVPNNI